MIRKIGPSILLALFATPLFAGADIFMLAQPVPSTDIIIRTQTNFSLSVLNAGPDAAHNVRVTFSLPPDGGIQAIFTDKGPCSVLTRPIVCSMGDVPAGASGPPFLNAVLVMPPQAGTVTFSATISSDTDDPHPENNTVARTFNVINATNLRLTTEVTKPRVDPGATTLVKTELHNDVPSSPSDIHIHYEATNATIDRIDAQPQWNCSISGSTADCSEPALNPNCRCSGEIDVALRVKNDRAGGTATLKATATTSLPQAGPEPVGSASVEFYRWIVVTSTADSGAGSLRDAIDTANAGCAAPCKIAFEIPPPVPASGWFTITPSTPLPAVAAHRVYIDGATQTAFTGDTNPAGPEIALDGRLTTAGHGIVLLSDCDAVVEGLSIGNFADHGVAFFGGPCRQFENPDAHRVAHDYLGVDPTGFTAAPNLRGVMANDAVSVTDNVISGNRRSGVWAWGGYPSVDNNRIGTAADGKTPLPNGNSGIFFGPGIFVAEALGNTIAYNGQMGVAIARGAGLVDVRGNSMRKNGGLGIDIGIDGPNAPVADDRLTQPNPPTLLSAVYDPASNTTVVTVIVRTNFTINYGNVAVLDFFANDGPDGQGERPLGFQQARNFTGDPFTANIPGDWRGKWINATSSRVHFIASLPPSTQSIGTTTLGGGDTSTSELSNAVLVQ